MITIRVLKRLPGENRARAEGAKKYFEKSDFQGSDGEEYVCQGH